MIDLLILGGGWTFNFLDQLLLDHNSDLSYISTTRDGRNNSIKWSFDDDINADPNQFLSLPIAKTVLIVFPLKGLGPSSRLLNGYQNRCNIKNNNIRWIQLGSSGIWDGGPTLQSQEKKPAFKWTNRHSPYATDNARAIAEDELLSLSSNTFVLNLSGLWGGERDPINWITRVAPTKEALATKSSIHLIHGLDVARAIVAVHRAAPIPLATLTQTPMPTPMPLEDTKLATPKLLGQRYLLTDLRVYDWWDLIAAWGLSPTSPRATAALSLSSLLSFTAPYCPGASGSDLLGEQPKWVLELMDEKDIHALPRSAEVLGRALDSRDFWRDFGIMPIKGRLERGRL